MSTSRAPILPSFHDHEIIGYQVDCVGRIIRLVGRCSNMSSHWTLTFEGVEAYRLSDDAFGNIVLVISAIEIDHFLDEHFTELKLSFNQSAAAGAWANDTPSATAYLKSSGLTSYLIESTIGLRGWIVARAANWMPAPRQN